MPSLTPVDNDPFQAGPTLTPVDHNPWAAGDEAVRQINLPDVGAPPVNLGYTQDWQPIGQAGDAARAAIGGIASIPQRAIEGSAADIGTMGSGKPMQSVGPATDAAMMMMGGAGVVPAEADALRAGMSVAQKATKKQLSQIDRELGMMEWGSPEYNAKMAERKAIENKAINPDQVATPVSRSSSSSGVKPVSTPPPSLHPIIQQMQDENAASHGIGGPVNILDVAKRTGIPLPDLHASIMEGVRSGDLTIHPTTAVDTPQEILNSAITIPGFNDPYSVGNQPTRFSTVYAKPKPGVAGPPKLVPVDHDPFAPQADATAPPRAPPITKSPQIESLDALKSALQSSGGNPLFVRYSRGPKFDMEYGAVSKDHQTGEYHSGLSAVELNGKMSDEKLVRYLRDYASGGDPHIYAGEVTGLDSDRSPTIRPTKYIGKLSNNLIDLIGDESVPSRLSLQQSIGQYRRVYDRLSPSQLRSLNEMESQLAAKGGPVSHPGLGKNFSIDLRYPED
jgi:hypothetical protein